MCCYLLLSGPKLIKQIKVVGFHATSLESAQIIIQPTERGGGFKKPTERGATPLENHIPLGTSKFGIRDWPDANFLSPSHKVGTNILPTV